jgi:hypothetical protein
MLIRVIPVVRGARAYPQEHNSVNQLNETGTGLIIITMITIYLMGSQLAATGGCSGR